MTSDDQRNVRNKGHCLEWWQQWPQTATNKKTTGGLAASQAPVTWRLWGHPEQPEDPKEPGRVSGLGNWEPEYKDCKEGFPVCFYVSETPPWHLSTLRASTLRETWRQSENYEDEDSILFCFFKKIRRWNYRKEDHREVANKNHEPWTPVTK